MTRFERTLAIGLGAVVVIWQGWPFLEGTLLKPINDRQAELTRLNGLVETQSKLKRETNAATVALRDFSARSLPPDPTVAATLYQSWLIEQATAASLRNVSVKAGAQDVRPRADTYFELTMTVRGQATLSQVVAFLVKMRNTPILHRVSKLSLKSTGDPLEDPVLDASMDLQALCLLNSPARTVLFAPKVPEPGTFKLDDIPGLKGRNPFLRGFKRTAPPPPPRRTEPPAQRPTTDPPFDSAEFVVLVASLSAGGQSDAWLFNQATNEQYVLREGEQFSHAGVAGKCKKIMPDAVVLELSGSEQRLELGESLREVLNRLPKSATQTPADAAASQTPQSPSSTEPATETPTAGATPSNKSTETVPSTSSPAPAAPAPTEGAPPGTATPPGATTPAANVTPPVTTTSPAV